MRTRLIALIGLLLTLGLVASSAGATTNLVKKNERVFFAINCIRADPTSPTCDSTAYQLSRQPGDSSVGSSLAVTPLDYITYHTNGYRMQAFSRHASLPPTYTLQGGSTIKGQVTLRGYNSTMFAADSGVYVEISAMKLGDFASTVLGEGEITKVVALAGVEDGVYEFEFTVPADLEGVEVEALSAAIGQRHITALGSGFMDGQGGSYFTLPVYVAQ